MRQTDRQIKSKYLCAHISLGEIIKSLGLHPRDICIKDDQTSFVPLILLTLIEKCICSLARSVLCKLRRFEEGKG
jgi:hypothetical protein